LADEGETRRALAAGAIEKEVSSSQQAENRERDI